jgi:crossover junction endodeoxyribonuclease RuvC
MIVIGIDPGLTGAIAFIDVSGRAAIDDIPTLQLPGDGMVRRRIDGLALGHLVRQRCPAGSAVLVACEAVSAMGGQDNALQTQGSLMRTLGAIEGVFDVLRWPCKLIQPQTWQAHYGLRGKKNVKREAGERPAAIVKALELHPEAAVDLARIKDHNRAEALLIARYAKDKLT